MLAPPLQLCTGSHPPLSPEGPHWQHTRRLRSLLSDKPSGSHAYLQLLRLCFAFLRTQVLELPILMILSTHTLFASAYQLPIATKTASRPPNPYLPKPMATLSPSVSVSAAKAQSALAAS